MDSGLSLLVGFVAFVFGFPILLALLAPSIQRSMIPSLKHFSDRHCSVCDAQFDDIAVITRFQGKRGLNGRVLGLHCSSCDHVELITMPKPYKKQKIRVS